MTFSFENVNFYEVKLKVSFENVNFYEVNVKVRGELGERAGSRRREGALRMLTFTM